MKKISSDDKAFLNEVWKKINILSYEKQEQDLVKSNNLKYLKRNICLALFLLVAPLILSSLVIFKFGFDQFTLTLISLLLLAMCKIFEHMIDMNTGDN